MPFTLRADQAPLADRAFSAMGRGETPCIVAPTGAGKTVILAEIARRERMARRRVVAVAHRAEIVDQLCASLSKHMPEERIEIVKAGTKPSFSKPVTVAMVPTLARRTKSLALLDGATLIQDECHHAGAKSWERVTAAINPGRRCGLTATPVRPNGQGLGDEGGFTQLILGPSPRDLMEAGHLCRYEIFCAPRSARTSTEGMRCRGGDFVASEMEARVQQIAGRIVPTWLKLNPGRLRTITVAVTVDHAMTLAAEYRAHGIAAAAVVGDGSLTRSQGFGGRDEIFRLFKSGRLSVLVACAVVDEGLDVPEATVLQITRPTASLRLWFQLIGRVLRVSPGKAGAIIIDHTDNWHRLPLPETPLEWSLFSPPKELEAVKPKEEAITGRVKVEVVPLEVKESDEELVALRRTGTGRLSPMDVKSWLKVAVEGACKRRDVAMLKTLLPASGVMDIETLRLLGHGLGHPNGWGETQAWFAEMDSRLRTRALAAARDIAEMKLRSTKT